MSETDRLLDLAMAASDGARVDWDREEEGCRDDSERRLVRALGLVASVLGEHRRLQGGGEATGARRTWGSLEILEEIGEGSFGKVYRARDPRLDRSVALKLRPAEPGSAESLVAEGRLMARVRHPNVATVHGADIHDGMVGLWMELVEGPTLAAHLRERGFLSVAEAIGAGIELCAALAAVHSAGLVHGDVKPQNIVRHRDGRLVLTDFGAGRDLLMPVGPEVEWIRGTPLFMAPEVLAGGPQSARSDIYSLGAVLFNLLTARFPVEAANLGDLRSAHAAHRERPLRDLRPDLPDRLVAAVSRALAHDPAARFASAGELESALIDALRGTAGAARGLRKPLLVAVAAVMILAAALVTLRVAMQGGDEAGGTATAAPGAEMGQPASGQPGSAAADGPAPHPPPAASVAGGAVATLFRAGQVTDELLESGVRVRPGDRLYLEFRADVPMHVYVVNLDRRGQGYLLFPVEGAQWRNPLEPGSSYRLPGSSGWESDSWEVTSAGGKDSIVLVASVRPLDRLEGLLGRLQPATPGEQGDAAADGGDVMRGVARLAVAARPSGGGAAAVAAALRDLTSEHVHAADVIVREIILDNP